MIGFFDNIIIPQFIIYLIISGAIVGFQLWRVKDKVSLRFEGIFDLVLVYISSSIFFSRIIFIFDNINSFKQLPWSIYPFYYEPGAERIWLTKMPWVIFKIGGGDINYSALILGGVISILIFFRLKKIALSSILYIINALCIAHIIQFVSFYLNANYWGEVTSSWYGIKYSSIDESSRIPLQVIEIMVIIILLVLIQYLKKIKKIKIVLGIYLFTIGWMEVFIGFYKENVSKRFEMIQIVYLVFILGGILSLLLEWQKGLKGGVKASGVIDRTKTDTSMERAGRRQKLHFSYKDFKTSFGSKGRSSSLLEKIKGIIPSIKSKNRVQSEGSDRQVE